MIRMEQTNAPRIPEGARTVIRQVNPGLPIPDLVSYYALENDRKLYLEGEVDVDVLELQRMILRFNIEDAGIPREQRKPIRLYIMSPGGSVDMMWSLIDAIELSETPVYTINMGIAASAAGIIFLAGHKRIMTKRSRLMIHEGSARMAGDAIKVIDASENYKKQIKAMQDFILATTKITASALNRQKSHDWEIDAKYCLEHGACEMIAETMSDII